MAKPQFTLSFLFKLVAACALPSLIAGQAAQGAGWAVGICVGLLSAAIGAVALVAVFAAAYGLLHSLFRLYAGPPQPLPVVPIQDEGR